MNIQKKLFIQKSGFTLMELLVVVGILAILITIIFNIFVGFRNKEALSKDINLAVEVLRQAKNQTLNSKNSYQYGVHFSTNNIILFIGSSYPVGSTTNQTFTLNPDIQISATSLNGGGSDVIFQRLNGSTQNFGSITMSSKSSANTKVITVYKTGLTE